MLKDLIQKEALKVETELINNYKRLGLKASGKWANELETQVEFNGDNVNIKWIGTDYSQFMAHGREKNKNQDKKSIKSFVGWAGNTFLKQWVKDKGLTLNPFAVAYNIATKGIKIPNANNQGGVISDVINENRLTDFAKIVESEIVGDIKSDLYGNK